MYKILLSNDDGYKAQGLMALKASLQKFADVYVLAPHTNRSACSSSLDTRKPIYCNEHSDNHYYCDGTSATCAHLGINGFFDFTPDLVVSGINCGGNMGDDALYSGTLAAALEGRFLPTISVAVSLACGRKPLHFDVAAAVAAALVQSAQSWSLPPGLVLNVNVPDLPLEQIRGWRSTRLGHRERSSNIGVKKDEKGQTYYELGLMGKGCYKHPHAHTSCQTALTDFEAVADQYVSVTPICADMTFIEALTEVNTRLDETPPVSSL
ncbi:MAG: 5'/3'-nucleotidase SurE [Proteobacteria bacterium]|nr:5'/3'-nucleotidase SurE [Pseudomonadota bacterium]